MSNVAGDTPKERNVKLNRIHQTRMRTKRRGEGLCITCGKQPPKTSRDSCESCLQIMRANTMRIRSIRIAAGQCFMCGCKSILSATRRGGVTNPLCEICYLKRKAAMTLGDSRAWRILQSKLIAQNSTCPYSGEKIILGENDSIDHIKPVSRYPELECDPNNVEWVTYDVNMMKRHHTREEFLHLIRLIAEYQVSPH